MGMGENHHLVADAAGHAGLTSAEAAAQRALHGPNTILELERLSALREFVAAFRSPLFGILIFAAAISAYFGQWISAVTIIVMVVFSGILDFVNTYRSQRAAEALRARVTITATVVRDGTAREVRLTEIVPDDIVLLTPGDIVPADGALLDARDLFVDESSFTGESFPAEKVAGGTALMGTSVTTGRGVMRVTATGHTAQFGKIAQSIAARTHVTEFDRSIKNFSTLIMKAVLVLVIAVFFVNALEKQDVLNSLLFAVALAVGLTPELLPMVITINLAKGSLRMARHGVIVKRLAAIQNFGSMDVLCTDKTGTLTENRITLVKYEDGFGNRSDAVLRYAVLSSTFHTSFTSPLDDAILDVKPDTALAETKVDEIPFDYQRKRDSVVVELSGARTLITKGAPEELLGVSTSYGATDRPLSTETVRAIIAEYHALSNDGFRVLGIAIRPGMPHAASYTKEAETGLTFLGFVAFLDPPKRMVRETLGHFAADHIAVKILTGDNELVTRHIATELDLMIHGEVLGRDLAGMTDEKLALVAEQTTIFARVDPEQKRRIIRVLQSRGHVVGYLGDGVNDAPSLRAADIGISVNNAVDIAKESADLILLQKSLADLVGGVREGRRTFMNANKYLMMGLSSNFGNMFSMAGASIFLPFLPMLPAQILLNNLLYDLSQFALPLDHVDDADLREPKRMDIRFIKRFMLVFGPVSSLFDFLTFGALYFLFRIPAGQFQTGWFLESLSTQILVIFLIRTRRFPFWKSGPAGIVAISAVGAIAAGWLVALTSLGNVFGFARLPLPLIGIIVGITLLYLAAVETTKYLFYRNPAHRAHRV